MTVPIYINNASLDKEAENGYLQFYLNSVSAYDGILVYSGNYDYDVTSGKTINEEFAHENRDYIVVNRNYLHFNPKRVVAVAGDTVQLKDSRVYINHVYLSPYTCDADIAAAYNLEADHYFVLGDNDGASIDSRDFGIISKEHIIGKVILF